MGKYHPHGDSSIYEALVVMAQEFKKGLPLVGRSWKFRLHRGRWSCGDAIYGSAPSEDDQEVYLRDLDKNVVDFIPNFDGTEKEPEVLPVRVPNLLVNGADGIAVGMATQYSAPQSWRGGGRGPRLSGKTTRSPWRN